jgi:hypothetical protein
MRKFVYQFLILAVVCARARSQYDRLNRGRTRQARKGDLLVERKSKQMERERGAQKGSYKSFSDGVAPKSKGAPGYPHLTSHISTLDETHGDSKLNSKEHSKKYPSPPSDDDHNPHLNGYKQQISSKRLNPQRTMRQGRKNEYYTRHRPCTFQRLRPFYPSETPTTLNTEGCGPILAHS